MNLLRRSLARLFPMATPVVGSRIDGWKVRQPLGESRTGSLFLVERAGRLSVLKWQAVTRPVRKILAEQELACLRHLSGPGFVRLESHGRWPDEERGTPFLVLEHIPGLSLSQWTRQSGATAHDIVVVFHSLVSTVAELNARGIWYPALACGDVWIRQGSRDPVLVDLGGAVSCGRTLTPWETSQDVQAVGAMLYEVLTLQRPGPSAPPPHVINPRVPRELSEFTMRLL
ncbi:MAG TPA: protein kinase [Myxococcaceae bacterium]|jgi:serine/threonine-protein kinase